MGLLVVLLVFVTLCSWGLLLSDRKTGNMPAPIAKSPSMVGWMQETDSKIDHLNRRMEKLSHRQWLMVVTANENAYLNKKVADKVKSDVANKYLFFDHNWKLNKSPEFVRMTDEDRKAMIKDLR